jgi:anti-anti-sigma factor
VCLLYDENAERDFYVGDFALEAPEVLATRLLTTTYADGMLSLHGEVDNSNVGELDDALSAAIGSQIGVVVLDLTHLTFIDVAGIRVVERQARQLSESGKRLVLSSPPAFFERLLEVLDLDEVIEVAV